MPDDDQTEGSILDQIDPQGAPKDDGKDWKKDFDSLQAQLQTMSKQLEQERQTNLALMSQPQGHHGNQAPIPYPKQVSAEGLPDPIYDKDAYTRELTRRIQESVASQYQYMDAVRRHQEAPRNQADALWDDFSRKHSEYAGDENKVEFAATKVVQRLNGMGVDINRYMNTAREQFYGDVMREYDTVFGTPTTQNPPKDTKPATLEEPNRTTGMFGGTETGGTPSDGPPERPEGSLSRDLQDIQLKLGIY